MLFSLIWFSNKGFSSLLIRYSRFLVAQIKCINTLVYGMSVSFLAKALAYCSLIHGLKAAATSTYFFYLLNLLFMLMLGTFVLYRPLPLHIHA